MKTQREGEREREKAKKYEWNSMLVSVEAVRIRRIFNSSLLLCLFFLFLSLSTRLHHRIYEKQRGQREREKGEKNAYSIFRIFKQVSVLFLSSMFVYSSWCTELDDLRYSRSFWATPKRRKTQFKEKRRRIKKA